MELQSRTQWAVRTIMKYRPFRSAMLHSWIILLAPALGPTVYWGNWGDIIAYTLFQRQKKIEFQTECLLHTVID